MSRPVKKSDNWKMHVICFLKWFIDYNLLLGVFYFKFIYRGIKKYLMILLKDGLNYAEVLTEPPTSMHTRIRGIENRIMYSEIDHSLKALTGKPDINNSGFFFIWLNLEQVIMFILYIWTLSQNCIVLIFN